MVGAMQNSNNNGNKIKITQIRTLEQTASLIGASLPYSKVTVFFFTKDYFKFGIELVKCLKDKGVKPITVIINDHSLLNTTDSLKDYKFFEDNRGVIITNKKLIPFLSNANERLKAYMLIDDADILGTFVLNTCLNQNNRRINEPFNTQVEYLINTNKIAKQTDSISVMLKQVAVAVVMLMDYLIKQSLTKRQLDNSRYSEIKRLLVNSVILDNSGDNYTTTLLAIILRVQLLLNYIQDYYSFSPIVSSFLIGQDYFDLHNAYLASMDICNRYKTLFDQKDEKIKGHSQSQIDCLKEFSFVSTLDLNYILKDYICNKSMLNLDNALSVKQEIFKLTALFDDVVDRLNSICAKEQSNDKYESQIIKDCVRLSGLMPCAINGMSVI